MRDRSELGVRRSGALSRPRLSARRRAVCALAVGLTLTALMAAPARADERRRAGLSLVLVCPPEVQADLAARFRDLLGAPPPGDGGPIQIESASHYDPTELFQLESRDRDRPTAWVVVDGGVGRVRVAGAGRERFVFRDLAVSMPLTELDRERLGQTLKAALVTVIEGGPSALRRHDAQAAAEIQPVAAPPLVAPAAGPSGNQKEPALVGDRARAPSPNALPLAFRLGGFLEVSSVRSNFAYGPGIMAAIEVTSFFVDGGAWLSLMSFLPHGISPDSPAAAYGVSFRAGLTLGIAPLPWLRLDLGLGDDWPRPKYFAGGEEHKVPVYRFGLRLAAPPVAGLNVGVILFLEWATRTIDQEVIVKQNDVRPGFALALWWH